MRSLRRVFIEAHELPGLLGGLARGEGRAQRRILGARRGGRWGVLLAAAGTALACPPRHWPLLLLAHAGLSLLGWGRARRSGLRPLPNQRLLLWWVGLALALGALGRALGAPALPAALLALAAAHAGHAGNLQRGLEAPARWSEPPRAEPPQP